MRTLSQGYGSGRIYAREYKGFRGVDMSADPALINESRSPFAPNLISDTGGNPEKRAGWRTLLNFDAPINGLFSFVSKGTRSFVIHSGTKLYKWSGTGAATQLYTGLSSERSTGFSLGGKLWLLCGTLLCYDGETLKKAEEVAYVPLVIIARKPSGGGTLYENINLLTGKQKNSFLADGVTKIYELTAKEIASVDSVEIDGVLLEASKYSVEIATGKITFTTAPAVPTVAGQDNVLVTFTKNYTGYADRIACCTTAAVFANRVFVTGNPAYPNRDWYCNFENPTYFPDLSYNTVGDENTEIMGYRRLGQYLAIIKAENSQDSTLYLRQYQQGGEGDVIFPTFQGAVGVGAVSRHAFANLIDEPLFLSRTGVYAITSNTTTGERTLRNRSYFVDSALTKEQGLENAVACEWNGYYVLVVGGRAYILDGKQNKSGKGAYSGDFSYECYHWDNIPARVLLSQGGELYFGTAEGKLCKMNTDVEGMAKYSDDGTAIAAYWSTKADDDGDFMTYKNLRKRGGGIMMKPYTRSSVKVHVRTDKDAVSRLIQSEYVDVFDWEDIDFNRFTFNSNDAPQVIPFNFKVKKYLTLQIILKNDALNEGFGVFGVTKRYSKGNFKK